jgi:hypothetical protein
MEKKIQSGKRKAVKNTEDYNASFETVCLEIEKGKALRKVCPAFMSVDKFHKMCSDDKQLNERYARACEIRAETIFDEIIDISDGSSHAFDDPVKIQRDRLKIDARKWAASKLAPKRYGDKIDVTSDGEKIKSHVTIFQLPDNGR